MRVVYGRAFPGHETGARRYTPQRNGLQLNDEERESRYQNLYESTACYALAPVSNVVATFLW